MNKFFENDKWDLLYFTSYIKNAYLKWDIDKLRWELNLLKWKEENGTHIYIDKLPALKRTMNYCIDNILEEKGNGNISEKMIELLD
mgnify:CR=1 FL=1